MVLGRGGELNAGIVGAVVDNNVRLFSLNVVTGVDSDASSVLVESLGCLNGLEVEFIAGRGGKTNRKVVLFVGGINVEIGMVALLSIDLGAGRDTDEREKVVKSCEKAGKKDSKGTRTNPQNAYPHPETSVEALPHTRRGRDARSDVGVAEASIP